MPSVECLHFPMNVSRIQTALLQMNWGLNPLFDTFDCQVHFFEGTGLAEQLRMRKPFCCYRFQGWKDRKKEATRNSSCVCLSICFNGVLIIFLKYVLTVHGLIISHKILVKLPYIFWLVSNISPLSIARFEMLTGMAPTEKSPGRLVGKINWRINEAPEWNELEKFEVLVSEVKLSVIILYMSYVFHIVSLVIYIYLSCYLFLFIFISNKAQSH